MPGYLPAGSFYHSVGMSLNYTGGKSFVHAAKTLPLETRHRASISVQWKITAKQCMLSQLTFGCNKSSVHGHYFFTNSK